MEVPKARGELSRKQKARLAMLARRAYDLHLDAGLVDDGAGPDDWRRAEVSAATGGRAGGLREATQRDYRQIRGHFLTLAGEEPETAFQDAAYGSPEAADREQAAAVLRRETLARDLPHPAYPEKICRQKYKTPLSRASAKQLWSLVYTVRNRR